MQGTAISRGNVEAISGKQEAPTVIYHSHSRYKCQQTRLGIKMHTTLFTKQWRFISYELDWSWRVTSDENNKGEWAPNRRQTDVLLCTNDSTYKSHSSRNTQIAVWVCVSVILTDACAEHVWHVCLPNFMYHAPNLSQHVVVRAAQSVPCCSCPPRRHLLQSQELIGNVLFIVCLLQIASSLSCESHQVVKITTG